MSAWKLVKGKYVKVTKEEAHGSRRTEAEDRQGRESDHNQASEGNGSEPAETEEDGRGLPSGPESSEPVVEENQESSTPSEEDLRAELDEKGIKYDKRWGRKKLLAALNEEK